jgi:hypothetical protein
VRSLIQYTLWRAGESDRLRQMDHFEISLAGCGRPLCPRPWSAGFCPLFRLRCVKWRKPPGLRSARVDSEAANGTSLAAYGTVGTAQAWRLMPLAQAWRLMALAQAWRLMLRQAWRLVARARNSTSLAAYATSNSTGLAAYGWPRKLRACGRRTGSTRPGCAGSACPEDCGDGFRRCTGLNSGARRRLCSICPRQSVAGFPARGR